MTEVQGPTDRIARIALGVCGALLVTAGIVPDFLGWGSVGVGAAQLGLLIPGVTLLLGSVLMPRVRATEPARVVLSMMVLLPSVFLESLVNVAILLGGPVLATGVAVTVYGGPVALALGILSVRRPTVDRLATRIPLIVATVVVTLVIADLAIRSLGLDPDDSAPIWVRQVGTPIRKSEIPGIEWELIPNHVWGHRYSSDERQYFGALGGVDYETNAAGYRDSEFSPSKAGAYRIALLGDSFAFGVGVRVEDSVATLLEPALSDASGCTVEILNF